MDRNLKHVLLSDNAGIDDDMMVIGYEIQTRFDLGKGTSKATLYPVIPLPHWNNPYYGNPGHIDENTGDAKMIWEPVGDGMIGIRVYFQFINGPGF